MPLNTTLRASLFPTLPHSLPLRARGKGLTAISFLFSRLKPKRCLMMTLAALFLGTLVSLLAGLSNSRSLRLLDSRASVRPSMVGGYRRQVDLHRFPASHLRRLVLVACHSVYIGLDFTHVEDMSSWALLDYQKVGSVAHSFVTHIQQGVRYAAEQEDSMLLFSGGKTRIDAGPRAEALGYWLVAEANDWFGHKDTVRKRAFTEEHARDSFENLLFGLCRFYELTGHYPEHLIVIGYDFKEERFSGLHRAALRWPIENFQYVGTPAVNEGASEGESHVFSLFQDDPYGCQGSLAEKRELRDPFATGPMSPERCPDLADLLHYCSHDIYPGALPWSN